LPLHSHSNNASYNLAFYHTGWYYEYTMSIGKHSVPAVFVKYKAVSNVYTAGTGMGFLAHESRHHHFPNSSPNPNLQNTLQKNCKKTF